MTAAGLAERYRGYIGCLNAQDWINLDQFVAQDVTYNGEPVGVVGYRRMLEGDFRAIPDLHFEIELLVVEPPYVASRLQFDCTPVGELFGLPINGTRVQFAENVFYEFRDGGIVAVRSIIDKAGVAAQL